MAASLAISACAERPARGTKDVLAVFGRTKLIRFNLPDTEKCILLFAVVLRINEIKFYFTPIRFLDRSSDHVDFELQRSQLGRRQPGCAHPDCATPERRLAVRYHRPLHLRPRVGGSRQRRPHRLERDHVGVEQHCARARHHLEGLCIARWVGRAGRDLPGAVGGPRCGRARARYRCEEVRARLHGGVLDRLRQLGDRKFRQLRRGDASRATEISA